MWCGNNFGFGGCSWIIILIIILLFCGNNGNCGCNDGCGCGNGCGC